MIKHVYFISIVTLLLYSCTSIPRFTSEDEKTVKTETIENTSKINQNIEVSTDSVKMIEVGIASFYAHEFHRKMTANGEIYNMYGLSAAHPTLPLNTIIRVTNLGNKKTVVLKVNDRMPQHPERIIDLSLGAAEELGFEEKGLQQVKVEVIVLGDNKRVD